MLITTNNEQKGLTLLETLDENVLPLLKGDVYALFHNCVLLTVQVITHEFKNVNTLNSWDVLLKKVDERCRDFTTLAQTLQIDSEDEIFQLLESLQSKLHTTVVDNNLFYVRKEIETFLDTLISDISRYITSKENLYNEEQFFKNLAWDTTKPFTMKHLYQKITGKATDELNGVLRNIAEIIEEELDIISGGSGSDDDNDNKEINKIRKSLNNALQEIEENNSGGSGITENQFLNTVKHGIRLLVIKHSKRLYLNEDDPQPIKDEIHGSYSVIDNMCVNPNLIYKFIALYEFYKNKLRIADVEVQFENLPYENLVNMCKGSAYNTYYENVYNIMLESLLHFEAEPECSQIRKNFYFYLYMIIRRIMSEVFANPFAMSLSTQDILYEDSKDYVKKLKDGSLILNTNNFATKPPIINLAMILQRFGKIDKTLANDALELYNKYKTEFVSEVGKYMESAYETLNVDMKQDCTEMNDEVNSPIFSDRSVYTNLVAIFQNMKSKMVEGGEEEFETDGILSAILNMENKYVKYITENELLPPTIESTTDEEEGDVGEKIQKYNVIVNQLEKEWENFKYYTIGYEKSLLGKTKQDNSRLINILNEMVNNKEDVGGLLSTFRRIMLTDVWKDNDKLNEDIKQMKKAVTDAKQELMDIENEKIKSLIQNGNYSDTIKVKLLKYIENDAKIKRNLELIAEKKIEPVIMESLLNKEGEEEAYQLIKTKEERDELIKKISELQTIQTHYQAIQKMLKNDTNDTELITSISNLIDQVKRDEEQISNHEIDIKKYTKTIDVLQTQLHDKIEHDDVTMEEIKANYEDNVEKYKEENDKLQSSHKTLTQQYENLNQTKDLLLEKYKRLESVVSECKQDKSQLKETISLVSSLEEQLSDNTINENECKKELSQVNQKMIDITKSLSRVEKEMGKKNDQLRLDSEKDLENYSQTTDKLKRHVNDLSENIEHLKTDARDNLNKIVQLYGKIDNVKTYEDLIDIINNYNEAQRKTMETVTKENDEMLKILMINDVEGGIGGLSELLQQTEKTNQQLERIHKNIKTDLCTVFNRYDVKSDMCSDTVKNNNNNVAHHLSLIQTTALPQLVTLLNEKAQHINTIEQTTKGQTQEITDLKNSLVEKNLKLETLQRNFDNLVSKYNNDGNVNKGKVQELSDEIKSLRNDKKEIENRNKQTKDSNNEEIKTLNGKIQLLENTKTKLIDDVNRHAKEYQKVENEVKRLQDENKSLTNKQTTIAEVLRKKGIDVDNLRQQLESLVKDKNDLEKDITALHDMNKKLVEKHTDGISVFKEEYNQQLLVKEKIIEDLNEKLKDIKSKLETTNVQFTDLQRELYTYQKYKEETERSNLEMKTRLQSKETNYENEIERTQKLNNEIIKLKSTIQNLESTNSFLKENVENLKTKNEALDKNIETLGTLQKQNQHLTNEKNKLLRELKELKSVKTKDDEVIKELEIFINNVSEYKYNVHDNRELIKVLKTVEEQFEELKLQNINYTDLVQDYEKRIETYKKELIAPPAESVFDELSTKYAQAQKQYNENIKRLTREVDSCKNKLSEVDKKLNTVDNVKDEMRRKLETLQIENERLKKECHNVQFKIDSMKHESIVPENCEEHLKRAHEKRLKMFGKNIEELVTKIEEKKRVLEKHKGKNESMMAILSKLRHSKVNVSSDLKLPKNCNEYSNTLAVLTDIDTKYKTVDEYITDVYDAFSDLFQLGQVFVRMKPPVSSGKYEYDTRNPVVEIIAGENPFDKNVIIVNGKRFKIDSYFDENVTNKDIFTTIESTLTAVKKHKTVFIIVYGQTGSGKSYTITGAENDKGLLSHVYQYAQTLSRNDLVVRLYGLYNNNIYDLTKIQRGILTSDSKPTDIAVVPNVAACAPLKNISYAEMERLLHRGTILRKTKFNDRSSRAHSFIDINLPKLRASIVLVDLCGNETTSALPEIPIVKSESSYINNSLMEISIQLLQRFRRGIKPMLSGKLKSIFDYYMKRNEVKINTIFHIHKYLTDTDSVNHAITTSTTMTLQRADEISTM